MGILGVFALRWAQRLGRHPPCRRGRHAVADSEGPLLAPLGALQHTCQYVRPVLGGLGRGHGRGLGHHGLRTLAELTLCPRDCLYSTLMRVPGATADVPVAQPAELDKSLALGAFNARLIGLSTRRLCQNVLLGVRFSHLIKGGCFGRCFVRHYPEEYPPVRPFN
jgi:hypothetical protein